MSKEIDIFIEERPWGCYRLYKSNCAVGSVKILEINAGERLSVQRHSLREEEWYLIKGKVSFYRGSKQNRLKEITLQENENVLIKKGEWHSLENTGNGKALVLEISTGFYDENDIERAKDKYGRV